MPQMNNPAGRLFFVLEDFLKQQDKDRLETAWANVLGLEDPGVGDINFAIADVILLVQETKEAITQLDVDQQLYLKPFINIQQFLGLSINQTVQKAREFVTRETMGQLRYCDDVLSRQSPEPVIEEDILKSLRTELLALLVDVTAMEIAPELKELILSNLTALISAVERYRLVGTQGIENAANKAFGATAIYSMQYHKNLSKNDKNVIEDLINAIDKTLNITKNVATIGLIAANVSGYLGSVG